MAQCRYFGGISTHAFTICVNNIPSLLPTFQVSDSPFLPNMLCYSCIVQLNLAYNFKNVVIETHMYLERLAIESGGVATMTPEVSSIMDDDEASIISSIRPNDLSCMPLPPPMSITSSCAVMESPDGCSNTQGQPISSQSENEEFCMMEASQIKREPIVEGDDDDRDFVMRSAIEEIMASHSKKKETRMKTIATISNPETPKKTRHSHPASLMAIKKRASPTKKPMVAVHKAIVRSRQSDQAYLEKVLRKKVGGEHTRKKQTRQNDPEKEEVDPDTSLDMSRKMESVLVYDLNNSKMIRDILENLPKKRLRTRRTSTL